MSPLDNVEKALSSHNCVEKHYRALWSLALKIESIDYVESMKDVSHHERAMEEQSTIVDKTRAQFLHICIQQMK